MQLFTLLALAPIVLAHFRVNYPTWRGDALSSEHGDGTSAISEWNYPCAGFSTESNTTRTDWDPVAGPVVWNSSHSWGLAAVNFGIGQQVSAFNISLLDVSNVTTKGVVCIPNAGARALSNVADGTQGSIQIINLGTSGSALYNCMDVTIKRGAAAPEGVCTNATNMNVVSISGLATGRNSTAAASTSGTQSSSGSTAPRDFVPIVSLFITLATGIYTLL